MLSIGSQRSLGLLDAQLVLLCGLVGGSGQRVVVISVRIERRQADGALGVGDGLLSFILERVQRTLEQPSKGIVGVSFNS